MFVYVTSIALLIVQKKAQVYVMLCVILNYRHCISIATNNADISITKAGFRRTHKRS